MVIIYEDSNKAVRALYCLRETRYEDKHLLGKYVFIFHWFDGNQEAMQGNTSAYMEYNLLGRGSDFSVQCHIQIRSGVHTACCSVDNMSKTM
jgi:hypothetical protein